jgi:hypothetical protein
MCRITGNLQTKILKIASRAHQNCCRPNELVVSNKTNLLIKNTNYFSIFIKSNGAPSTIIKVDFNSLTSEKAASKIF